MVFQEILHLVPKSKISVLFLNFRNLAIPREWIMCLSNKKSISFLETKLILVFKFLNKIFS